MNLIDNIPGLAIAIGGFIADHLSALPGTVRTEILSALGERNCIPQFTRTAEALYAAVKADGADAVTGDARSAAATLAGQLANFVASGYGTLSADDRGMKIYRAMRRELGETTTPTAANDPAVDEKFTPAQPAAVTPAKPAQ